MSMSGLFSFLDLLFWAEIGEWKLHFVPRNMWLFIAVLFLLKEKWKMDEVKDTIFKHV